MTEAAGEARARLLRSNARFRALWLSRSVSFTGDGVARVALVLLVASHGPGEVSVVLLADTAPRLLGPLAGAVTDRVDQRRLLLVAELGQGAVYAALAIAHLSLGLLLTLVAVAGGLSTLEGPAGKSSVPALVATNELTAANALLGTAFNLQVFAGPAIGGVLAGFAGTRPAFGVNAASFAVSAILLRGLGPLPPLATVAESVGTLWSETFEGIRYCARQRLPRAMTLGTLLFVAFAGLDNVALVFVVRHSLHGSRIAYGLCVAAFGAGMLVGSLSLTRLGSRVAPRALLVAGGLSGAVGTALTGVAPVLALAVVGQVVAGFGNSADLVAMDTLVQQDVPRRMLGRVFGTVGTGAQVGSGIAYAIGGPLISWTDARTTMVVAGVGCLVGLAALAPVWRRA